MDKQEALSLAEGVANRLRRETYARLVDRLLDSQETMEVVGPSGSQYQVEITGFWDDRKAGNLRVIVTIDDGGWRAFMPLTTGFIVGPDGSFVGE